MATTDLRQDPAFVRIFTKKGFTRRIPVLWGFDIMGYTWAGKIILEGTQTVVNMVLSVNVPTAHTDILIDSATDTAVPVGNHTWYLQWTDTAGMVREILTGPYIVAAAP